MDESLGIEAEDARAAGTLGYMTRALVNATLPYKNPKSPLFERKNGQCGLVIPADSFRDPYFLEFLGLHDSAVDRKSVV